MYLHTYNTKMNRRDMTSKIFTKLFLIIILLGITVSCSNEVSDWKIYGINGEVSSYTERSYKPVPKDGKWKKGQIAYTGNHQVLFNPLGNYTLVRYLDEKDKQTSKFVPKRKDGKLVEESFYNQDGVLLKRIVVENISDQNQSFVSFDGEGKKIAVGESLFKNNRILKQKNTEFQDGIETEYLLTFEYNENGNLVTHKKLDNEGNQTFYMRYEYLDFDDKNNWTARFEYSSEEAEEPFKITIREYEYY